MSEKTGLERRDFIKLALVGSAGASSLACHSAGRELAPLLVPEERLPAGVAYWSRGLCRECEGGCGVLVKRMEAIVPVTRDGKEYRQSRLVAKKLEGNPEHPRNWGGLCARGQAALESTYHPARLRTPLLRAGARGEGVFKPLSWDEALAQLTAAVNAAGPGGVAWLGRSLSGTEAALAATWAERVKASSWSYAAFPAPRAAADARRLDELEASDLLLSFGNFLETWPAQAPATRAYSRFRRRPGSLFIQVEPRLSLTASNAEQWVAIRPGTEGIFALGVAAELLRLRSAGKKSAAAPAPAWAAAYTPEEVARVCDISADQLPRIARLLAAARHPLVVGGPSAYAYPHGAFQQQAIGYLAELAGGNASGAAGDTAGDRSAIASTAAMAPLTAPLPPAPRLLIVHDINPIFSAPPAWNVRNWLRSIPQVVFLGQWPDETAFEASLVLPLSTELESWADDERASADGGVVATLNPPAMAPLHDTRSLIEILTQLLAAGGPEAVPSAVKAAVPAAAGAELSADPAEAAIQARWQTLQRQYAPTTPFTAFWAQACERGGFWTAGKAKPAAGASAPPPAPLRAQTSPDFANPPALPADGAYPYYLRLYESSVFGDGRGAWLTWLQELPDPTTSAMWCNWVEMHPSLAAKLGLRQGDGVWVESRAGKIELPVFLYPGIRPDTVAIPSGQGHAAGPALTHRGANGFTLLADARDGANGALAWAAGRVRLSPSGRHPELPLFGRSMQKVVRHR